MTKEEALKLALAITAIQEALAQPPLPVQPERQPLTDDEAITAIKEALAQTSTQCEKQPVQEPVEDVVAYHSDGVMTKFAELIVKECLDIASEIRGEPATDTHYVIGYDRACEKMISGIKEHFGVKE